MAYKFNPTTGKLDIVADPGGSDTQIQFNDGGTFGGDIDLTYNKTTNLLTSKGDILLDDGGSFTTTLQTVTATANRTISFPDATGTVALVGGSSGQVLVNTNGAVAGLSTLTADGSGNLTLTARLINAFNALASAPAKLFSGTWFTGGTSTTTKPHLLIEPAGTTSTSWNTAGTGLGVNAPSGFTGDLAWFGRNGTRLFSIDTQDLGQVNRTAYRLFGASTAVQYFSTTGVSASFTVDSSSAGFYIDTVSQHSIFFRPGVSTLFSLGVDGVMEFRDNKHLRFGTTTGTKLGTATNQKLGFFNATPIVQPASADQAALTNSTGGTADGTLSAVGNTSTADQAAVINDNFTELFRLQNEMRTALVNLGLIKGGA